MNRDLLLILIVALVVIALLAWRGKPAPEKPGVRVEMGSHGVRIDYGSETEGAGCCG